MEPSAPGERGAIAAAVAGAAVGVLGGLLGLGGAEFRLPLLVAIFGYNLRRAIPLNLAISLLAVAVAAFARLISVGQNPLTNVPGAVPLAMMLGGMLGAAAGSRWLSRLSDARLHTAVRILLLGIGVLLIAESLGLPAAAVGLPLGPIGAVLVAVTAGVAIGIISTLLGVAGGELIIPTLVLGFGVPIKSAGTMSLLISVPTMVVGLARHRAHGSFRGVQATTRIVVPMTLGTVVGSAIGGLLVAHVPAGAVKVLLGVVLIGSALRVFTAQEHPPGSTTGAGRLTPT